MNSFEMTDVDGDALTVITRDGNAWITCTSGADEVTVGPLPLRMLRRVLQSEPLGLDQPATTFLSSPMSSMSSRDFPEAAQELHLLPPMSARTQNPRPRARREA